jgi:putative hydrolase of the HAD superfamily
MWKSFCDEIGQTLDYNVLIDSFKNTKLDSDMITLVKELKQKFTIGMVTDNKVDRIETILEFNNLNKYFDVVSISARLHSGKEANHIFNDTLKKLNVLPEQCIFIDNTENNLVIPKQMGFRTLLFDDENRNFKIFKDQLQDSLK